MVGMGETHNAVAMTPKYIVAPHEHACEFTFVTLLASDEKYQRLISSISNKGFNPENSELLALDNRGGNIYDGYTYARRAVLEARGKYLVLTHDDLEFTEDGFAELSQVLDDLTEHDPTWAVAGNAGMAADGEPYRNLEDPYGRNTVDAFQKVRSLDENFLVLRRDRLVLSSLDLTGFHYYGADLCLQAEMQGASSYVVPFMLHHHSKGFMSDHFFETQRAFGDKYGRYFPGQYHRTTASLIILGTPTLTQKLHRVWKKTKHKAKRVRARLHS